MGDMSVEPSMEEILSSIKRIIAEEEAPTGRRRATRTSPPAPRSDDDGDPAADGDEVLELSDPMPAYPQAVPVHVASDVPPQVDVDAPISAAALPDDPPRDAVPAPTLPETRVASTQPGPAAAVHVAAPAVDPILSLAAADATRGALASLSRLMVKPEPSGDGTLEGLVRDMLRPMLREWLDANLPDMVEAMVSREIARISGQT
ncbi:DUF2497 domain-containing protein [uncultured Sphingomonas sp.]|uniref:DUF2497 domain-containing protein n=1 Tax=uncultured Sphingomonas sp. TaxID=158754 RepID=UPI0035CB84E8